MNISDPLGDMLTRIRNAQMRGMTKVVTPASKLRIGAANARAPVTSE
jgi:small subunit ribosomal protein S8